MARNIEIHLDGTVSSGSNIVSYIDHIICSYAAQLLSSFVRVATPAAPILLWAFQQPSKMLCTWLIANVAPHAFGT